MGSNANGLKLDQDLVAVLEAFQSNIITSLRIENRLLRQEIKVMIQGFQQKKELEFLPKYKASKELRIGQKKLELFIKQGLITLSTNGKIAKSELERFANT